jgi:dolichyl-phosphate-mannose--protein O-mannosyl transferase
LNTYFNERTTNVKDDDEFVTCDSAVKLSHYESNASLKEQHYLSSEDKNLGGGSGQQVVTAAADATTTNGLWWVRGPNDPEFRGKEAACTEGVAQSIRCGSIIRLTHMTSMKNLHSHGVKSPLSRQNEVSGFGAGDGKGDNGDGWKLVCDTTYWKREGMMKLIHVDSGKFLGASSTVKFTQQNCGRSCPIMNHLEASGRTETAAYAYWVVELGVHLSR